MSKRISRREFLVRGTVGVLGALLSPRPSVTVENVVAPAPPVSVEKVVASGRRRWYLVTNDGGFVTDNIEATTPEWVPIVLQ